MVGKRLNLKNLNIAAPLIVLAIGVGFKCILLAMDVFPLNADEAVVGLMARHILEGEWPTFFYGQVYLGSLDATFVALGMAFFGKKVLVIRLVQILLYVGTILTTIHLGEKIFQSRWTGWVAGLLMAIPALNVTLYTTVSLGGYGEALLIGNLLLILTLKIIETPDSKGLYLVWGGLAGLGFWTFGLTLIYSLPCGILILWKLPEQQQKKAIGLRVGLLLVAAAIGALPWIGDCRRFIRQRLGNDLDAASQFHPAWYKCDLWITASLGGALACTPAATLRVCFLVGYYFQCIYSHERQWFTAKWSVVVVWCLWLPYDWIFIFSIWCGSFGQVFSSACCTDVPFRG